VVVAVAVAVVVAVVVFEVPKRVVMLLDAHDMVSNRAPIVASTSLSSNERVAEANDARHWHTVLLFRKKDSIIPRKDSG